MTPFPFFGTVKNCCDGCVCGDQCDEMSNGVFDVISAY